MAANAFVLGKSSAGICLKILLPVVSQANISNQRKYR
jgi:hypothetical protein